MAPRDRDILERAVEPQRSRRGTQRPSSTIGSRHVSRDESLGKADDFRVCAEFPLSENKRGREPVDRGTNDQLWELGDS
jgi:hypothetical protein